MIFGDIEIILVACLVAMSAAIPGVFLVLRNVSMMSDAISHCVLLGIVLMFFVIKDIHSPLLMFGAVIIGVISVFLIEYFIKSFNVKKDASIGLVFSFFFGVSILLINFYAANIHLDQDSVLLGEIAFVPFNRVVLYGMDIGPVAFWVMLSTLVINGLFVFIFYKELTCAVFDRLLASNMGFRPDLIYYGLMVCVSFTTVGAFDAVGSVLIIALMITPPATAYLLSERLVTMLWASIMIGCLNAIFGYCLAVIFDASIAGSMCLISGVLFLIAFIFSKEHGVLMTYFSYKQQTLHFSSMLLTVQLYDHEDTKKALYENSFINLIQHMRWSVSFSRKVIAYSIDKGWIENKNDFLCLTVYGREVAKKSLTSEVL